MNGNNEKLLDDTGWQILSVLQQEGRIPFNELGKRVDLSPPAAAERVRRMEEAGMIAGYGAQLILEKLGLPIMTFIRINTSGDKCTQTIALVKELPEVLECYRVTGSACFIAKVAVSSISHLEALMDRIVPYGTLTTSVVLSAPVGGRVIDLRKMAL